MATHHITTPQQLQDISLDLSGDYILDNDLDMTGVSFVPIGGDGFSPFTGSFNGGGFKIINLSITQTRYTYYKEFSAFICYAEKATIQNVSIVNGSIALTNLNGVSLYCAFLVGEADGCVFVNCSVKNSSISVSFSGNSTVYNLSGMIGYGTISNDYVMCSVTDCFVDRLEISVEDSYNSNIYSCGGIFGQIEGDYSGSSLMTINKCYAKAVTISINSNGSAGGIALFSGYIENVNITECYSEGFITAVISGNNDRYTNRTYGVAGLIGETGNYCTLDGCYSSVAISLSGLTNRYNEAVAGFCGAFDGGPISVTNCYAVGSIYVESHKNSFAYWSSVGGFLGEWQSSGIIQNCYSNVSIRASGDNVISVGGFIGYADAENYSDEDNGVELFKNCYAVGEMTINPSTFGYAYVGGFLGEGYKYYYRYHGMQPNSDEIFNLINCCWLDTIYSFAIGLITEHVYNEYPNWSYLEQVGAGDIRKMSSIYFGYYRATHNFTTGDYTLEIPNGDWVIVEPNPTITPYDKEYNIPTLSEKSYGTDEDVYTLLQHKEHIVYDQGNPDAWDFTTPIWFERYTKTKYPALKGVGEGITDWVDDGTSLGHFGIECGQAGQAFSQYSAFDGTLNAATIETDICATATRII